MVTHIVFFRMHPEAAGSSGKENARRLVEQLRALPDKIDVLVDLEAGADFSQTPASYDVGLITRFNSREDLEAYRVHPEHQKVVEFVQKTTAERAVVDYETP
jgi:deoxycytidine triphosphate deaminase